jgi:hypothetical protein
LTETILEKKTNKNKKKKTGKKNHFGNTIAIQCFVMKATVLPHMI